MRLLCLWGFSIQQLVAEQYEPRVVTSEVHVAYSDFPEFVPASSNWSLSSMSRVLSLLRSTWYVSSIGSLSLLNWPLSRLLLTPLSIPQAFPEAQIREKIVEKYIEVPVEKIVERIIEVPIYKGTSIHFYDDDDSVYSCSFMETARNLGTSGRQQETWVLLG
jgi:hypothetical protein